MLDRRPLVPAHGTRPGVGQQVDQHVARAQLEQIEAGLADRVAPLLGGRHHQRLDGVDAERLDDGSERGLGHGRQSASTPDIALRPTSMTSHTRPAWNGSPAAKRAGTVNPSVFLPEPPDRRGADAVGAVGVRAHPHRARRVAGQLDRHLGEGGGVEHLHDAHAHRVERGAERRAGDVGGDVLGDGVGLQEGEERLLDREVAGVAGDVEIVAARREPGLELGGDEAAVVGRQRRVAHRGDVRRERDQLVEATRAAVGVARLTRQDLGHDLVGVAVDPALGELRGDELVQPRPERLDEARLVGRPGDVHVLAGAARGAARSPA